MRFARIAVNITISSVRLSHSFFLYIYICMYVAMESKAVIKLDVVAGTRKEKIVGQKKEVQSSYYIASFYDIRSRNR
jgi:hypothetical protein